MKVVLILKHHTPKHVGRRQVRLGTVAGLEIQEAEGQQFVTLDYLPPELTGELGDLETAGAFSKVVITANGSANYPREGEYDYREAPVQPFFASVEISGKWFLKLEARRFRAAHERFDEIRKRQIEPTTSYEAPLPEQPAVVHAEDVVSAKAELRQLLESWDRISRREVFETHGRILELLGDRPPRYSICGESCAGNALEQIRHIVESALAESAGKSVAQLVNVLLEIDRVVGEPPGLSLPHEQKPAEISSAQNSSVRITLGGYLREEDFSPEEIVRI